jgi:hypothetical protein
MLALPELHQRNGHWQYAAEAMMRAAAEDAGEAELATAEERLRGALEAEGVLERVKRR